MSEDIVTVFPLRGCVPYSTYGLLFFLAIPEIVFRHGVSSSGTFHTYTAFEAGGTLL
jgi:hypothetical protein